MCQPHGTEPKPMVARTRSTSTSRTRASTDGVCVSVQVRRPCSQAGAAVTLLAASEEEAAARREEGEGRRRRQPPQQLRCCRLLLLPFAAGNASVVVRWRSCRRQRRRRRLRRRIRIRRICGEAAVEGVVVKPQAVEDEEVVVWCGIPIWKRTSTQAAPKCWSGVGTKARLMFMFRSRRTTVTRRLLKAAVQRRQQRSQQQDGAGDAAAAAACGASGTDDCKRRLIDQELEEQAMVLLKKLQDNQLCILWGAVEGRGQDGASNCVLLPADIDEPHVLSCRMWRWPDLQHGGELRRLPTCRSSCDPVYICCNPYHWSRVYQPEIPPPPYSRCEMDRLKPEDRAPCEMMPRSFPGSFSTSGDDSRKNPLEWCKLAYWEQTKRVGPLFPVESPAVNIFGNVPYGDGLCLETLAQHNCNPPESVRHTRCKIGLGVTLSLEGDHVWVYNRSDNPIFVNSLTMESNDSLLPTRVPAEQCLCVYDPVKAALTDWDMIHNHMGPVDPNSIRISFAKGWGPRYCRQEITSCPCWIEILLAPCR